MKYLHRCGGILAAAAAAFSLFSPPVFAQPSNGVLREVYLNIAGNAISDLTSSPNFPNNPSYESIQPIFEAPSDIAESYGQRMRAQVAFALRRGGDAPPLMLRAAQRLQSLDAELARQT